MNNINEALKSVFNFKYQLIALTTEELLEYYDTNDKIIDFICDMEWYTSGEDILYFDKTINAKMYDFINEVRWNLPKDKEIIETMNKLLSRVIECKNADYETMLIRHNNFVESEAISRRIKNLSDNLLVDFLSFDYLIHDDIINGTRKNISNDVWNSLACINFIMLRIPAAIFESDEIYTKYSSALIDTKIIFDENSAKRVPFYVRKSFNHYYKKTEELFNELSKESDKVKLYKKEK